jgi:hypothetical protein
VVFYRLGLLSGRRTFLVTAACTRGSPPEAT